MKIKDVKTAVAKLPNVTARWNSDIGEWRIAYKGLLPERAEAMACYTDDHEDAVGTAQTMQRDYMLHVFEADKTADQRILDRAISRGTETVQ